MILIKPPLTHDSALGEVSALLTEGFYVSDSASYDIVTENVAQTSKPPPSLVTGEVGNSH